MVLFRRETAKRVLAATEWVETQRGTPPPADRTPTRAARGYDRVYGRVQLVQSSSGEGADTIYLTDVMATRGALPDLDNEGRLEVQNPFGWKVLEGDWVGAEWQQEENTWAIYEIGTPFVHVYLTEPLYECASAEGIPAEYSGEPITVYDDYGRVARDPVARRDEESGQWYAPEGTAVLVRWLEDKQHFTVFFLSKCDQNSSSSEEECPDRYSGTLDVLIPEPYRSGDYLCFPTKRLEFDCGILISVEDGEPVCEYVCCSSSEESSSSNSGGYSSSEESSSSSSGGYENWPVGYDCLSGTSYTLEGWTALTGYVYRVAITGVGERCLEVLFNQPPGVYYIPLGQWHIVNGPYWNCGYCS